MIPAGQRALLLASIHLAAPSRKRLGRLFYQRLFEIEPDLRELFPPDLERQQTKLTEMVGFLVENLERFNEMGEVLRAMGRRHAGYGTRADHYAPAGSALLYALGEVLGEAMTEEVEDAWLNLYAWVSEEMERGAASASGDR